jgi:hypothetical protein
MTYAISYIYLNINFINLIDFLFNNVFAGQDKVVGLVPVASDGRRARNSFIESLKNIWFGFNFNFMFLIC